MASRAKKTAAEVEETNTPQETLAEEPEMKLLNPQEAMLAVMMEMQRQIKTQGEILERILKKEGTSISESIPKPPNETTKVVDSRDAAIDNYVPSIAEGTGPTPSVDVEEEDRHPGAELPGHTWVPWRPSDLDKFPKKHVIPYPIPGLVWPEVDEEGRQKIRIIKQDLECWLTVGEDNYVSEFFSEVYEDRYRNWKELEKFKRTGGRGPWVHGGRNGENTWTYTTDVISFGIDPDGRPVGIDKSIWDTLPPNASFEPLG